MGTPVRVLLLVLLTAGVGWASGVLGAAGGPAAPAALGSDAPPEGGSLTFDPAVAAPDREAILAAVAGARPEARALIDRVAGRVRIVVGPTGRDAAGVAETSGDGRWLLTLDLAGVVPATGARGVERVVLHELGHVVDHTLVGPALAARLEAGIPRGWGCDQGVSGACADRTERFAESFAKWATGDIGVDLYIGYRVPPPGPSLDAWGAPLAALGHVD
jgi:hypothetical protein